MVNLKVEVTVFSNPQIQQQYDISLKLLDVDDAAHNKALTAEEVLAAHFLIAEFFYELGEGIGGVGVKDMNLLNSALSRQNACFDGVCKYTDFFDIGAALLYGLIKNHPFHDANKRTAFLSILYYLYQGNYIPSVSEKEFEDFLVDIADDKIKAKRRYKDLKRSSESPEVDYIAWYLRTKMRKVDKQEYLVTYRDLAKILRSFGFDLKYPSSGSISIIKYQERRLVSLINKNVPPAEIKVGTIKFPGDGKQVGKSVVRQVRRLTGLTEKKGYDSQVFYRDVDPLNILIAKYEAPLRRLANR